MPTVTNDDLRRVSLALQVLLWARAVFVVLVLSSLGGILLTGGGVAVAIYVGMGVSIATLAAMQIGILWWMITVEPLGMSPASVGGLFAGGGFQLLAGIFLVLALVPFGGLFAFVGVVLFVCSVLANEYQLPCMISEIAWVVQDADTEAGANIQARRARPSMSWIHIGCLPLLIIVIILFVTGVLGAVLAGGFLLFVLGYSIWAFTMGVLNSILLHRMAGYLSRVTAEEVRHYRRQLEGPDL
jgi:hypothetical protein